MRLAALWLWFLGPIAIWILISGLDDLFISAVFLLRRKKQFSRPTDRTLDVALERSIAILVPLWHEHRVIRQMLEHNLRAIRYCHYDVFVGVYPNDEPTAQAVEEVARRHARVHMAVGPHNGPTSKGDCLNWLFDYMRQYEERAGVHYDIVITHDAEDQVDPESLRLVNLFSRKYAMVQVPVLALPTPLSEPTHGLYCDEFAEFQFKDIPVRQRLGGFLPANGVGTGFSRSALEDLAAHRHGQVFDPTALTEDYENGFRLHALGYRQLFLPIQFRNGSPIATREYFPRNFRAAVRQRSRWVSGIVLQGWRNHGWRAPWPQPYWFWRDRKGLVGNLLSPIANLAYVAGLWWRLFQFAPPWLIDCCCGAWIASVFQMSLRVWLSARIYGWGFAALAPLRMFWGNVVNFCATVAAIRQFASATLRRRSMSWRKTEHVYARPRLGELLVNMRAVPMSEVENAASQLPAGLRLGEYLVQRRKLTEANLYRALSLQSGIPAGSISAREIDRAATRALPAGAARQWKVLPFRLEGGNLHLAVADLPSAELTRHLTGLSGLKIQYRLVPQEELDRLRQEFLPPPA